ncbi:hypothetical protein [Atlantibacter hermannii]|uniref:hypothetical protein n=1 Tax=Atlantibacter hermannii TaxID=565 RepID=UPI0034D6CA66
MRITKLIGFKMYKLLLLFVLCSFLSGCLTSALSKKIGDGKDISLSYSNDDIVGFSKGVDNNKKEGWVFIGKNFDYLLASGGDVIVDILSDDDIDKKYLTAQGSEKFVISNDGRSFTGNISIYYKSENLNDDVRRSLRRHGFNCFTSNKCELAVRFLSGRIHNKNPHQDINKVLMFHNPVHIEFYKETTTTSPAVAGAVLYPVTIAADIVTSPLQLIGVPVVAVLGMGSMKAH